MTTNEASRAEFEKWAANEGYAIHIRDMRGSVRLGEYANVDTQQSWEAWQAALASRPATIDPIHGDKREVIINALCASSNWMRGYAEAFVDDFVDGKAEYVAVGDIEALDRWDTFAECGHNGSGFVGKIVYPDGEFIRYEDISKIIEKVSSHE